MNTEFSSRLTTLRTDARLTNRELARLSDVPESTVAGLQTGSRRVGEYQARKLGKAFNLAGEELEEFVLQAINGCTEKILTDSLPYPSHLLNLLAVQLKKAGIGAEAIRAFEVSGDEQKQDVKFTLGSGKSVTLTTQLQYA
jgi:transcriptional regulator with XRE-family HTH domain